MILEREHAGRYTLRDADMAMIGQIVQSTGGWVYRNQKGYGPRQSRPTPAGALELAAVLRFISATDWRSLVRAADHAFSHNSKVAARDAR